MGAGLSRLASTISGDNSTPELEQYSTVVTQPNLNHRKKLIMKRARWHAAAGITVLALLTAACTGTGDATDGQPPASSGCGTGEPISVNLLYPTQPATLDPNFDTTVMFAQISRNLFDGLFRLNDDMEIEPRLASKFVQVDELTYDISLRDDIKWHDGSQFKATDVIATFDRIANDKELKSKQATYVSNVASVTAVSDYEVKFTLKMPDATFIQTLATLIFITPESVIEKVGNVDFGKNPVGTGPFKLESWKEGDSVVMAANCDYWGDKAIPSKVEFRFIAEPATQLSSLQSGEIDIATGLTADLAAVAKSSSGVSLKSVDGNLSYWLSINTLEGPMSNPLVRQALNYAVDKKTITESLLGGFATPIGQQYGPSINGYSEDVEAYPYDPERARKLLEEAGYGDGKLQVEVVNRFEDLNTVQQAVASYLGKVGITVTTKTDPDFFDTWLNGEMAENQIFIRSNTNLLMDADFALGLDLDGARRGLYFHTPETDAMIAKARGISDAAERQKAYDELNSKLYDLAPSLFLYSTDLIYAMTDRISWTPRADGAIYLSDVTKSR